MERSGSSAGVTNSAALQEDSVAEGPSGLTKLALRAVGLEREWQEEKAREHRARGRTEVTTCANPLMVGGDGMRLAALVDEISDIVDCLGEADTDGAGNAILLRAELVQLAAVAVAWIEKLDLDTAAAAADQQLVESLGEVDTTHECPAPACTRRIPFDLFACPQHWVAVSAGERSALNRAWRTEPGSDAYFEVRARCLAELGVPAEEIAAANGGMGLGGRS